MSMLDNRYKCWKLSIQFYITIKSWFKKSQVFIRRNYSDASDYDVLSGAISAQLPATTVVARVVLFGN